MEVIKNHTILKNIYYYKTFKTFTLQNTHTHTQAHTHTPTHKQSHTHTHTNTHTCVHVAERQKSSLYQDWISMRRPFALVGRRRVVLLSLRVHSNIHPPYQEVGLYNVRNEQLDSTVVSCVILTTHSLCSPRRDLSMNNLSTLPASAFSNLHFLQELWVALQSGACRPNAWGLSQDHFHPASVWV